MHKIELISNFKSPKAQRIKLHVESTFDHNVWQQITQFIKITRIIQALSQIILEYIQIHVSFLNYCQPSATVDLFNIILKIEN